MPLTGKAARHLRALAHHLDPVAQVGAAGVTDAVIEKVDRELEHHELIKVKVAAERDGVRAASEAICAGTGAECAQILGRTLTLYRPRRKKKPTIRLPIATAEADSD